MTRARPPARAVQVVVAHSERATLRVGDIFLKIDADKERIDREARVMALATIPTPTCARNAFVPVAKFWQTPVPSDGGNSALVCTWSLMSSFCATSIERANSW